MDAGSAASPEAAPSNPADGGGLDLLPEPVLLTDRDWRVRHVNFMAQELAAPDDWAGRPVWECISIPGLDEACCEAATRNSPVHLEARWAQHDAWFRVNIYSNSLGGTILLQKMAGAARTERDLRVSQERLELIIESNNLGLWYCDLPLEKLVWTAKTKAHFGLPSDAEVTIEDFYALLHPDDRDTTRRAIERTVTTADAYDVEYRVNLPGDQLRWIRAIGRAFPDESGVLRRFDGITMDVTEEKRNEDAVRHRQKLESIGLLAGGIAHDFNNLLVGILGSASLIGESLPADNEIQPLIDIVIKSGERAAHLTRQLLAYAGKGQLSIHPVVLNDVARETASLLEASISKSVRLSFFPEENLPPIRTDPGMMQQVIMNLVINASEAIDTERGGVVAIRTACHDIDAAFVRHYALPSDLAPGRYVLLEVRDNGCGMDEKTQARIFDPFFTTKFTGRGLGLAAVQGIVQSHHGAIRVRSQVGQGTTFQVYLPATAKTAVAPAIDDHFESLAYGTILLVDDEEIVRETARIALERGGFGVLVAAGGHEAVDLYRENHDRIDAVLLDASMPGMSGRQTLEALRGIDANAHVIVCSGHGESEIWRMFTGLHLDGIIRKPFTGPRLANQVGQIVKNKT